MKRFILLALAGTLGLAACSDDGLTGITTPENSLAAISDGANGGNQHFFFLAPLGRKVTYSGTFNPNLLPVVQVCAQAGAPCTSFSGNDVKVSQADEQYGVNWDTKRFGVSGTTYRITVRLADKVLGYADVRLYTSEKQAAAHKDQTTLAAVAGRTVPVMFRIEQGAINSACASGTDCVEATVGQAAATVVTPSGDAGAFFPAGAIPTPPGEVTVSIWRVNVQPGTPCLPTDLQQVEGCFRFETYPYLDNGFTKDVTVGICIDPTLTHEEEHDYQLHKYSERRGEGVVALKRTVVAFLSCDDFELSPLTAASDSRAEQWKQFAQAGIGRLMRSAGRTLGPAPLYAKDLGLGGMTISFSQFGWAKPGSAATPPTVAPSATTGGAAGITSNSATVIGSVNPNGAATVAYFLVSTSSDLSGASRSTDQSVGSGTGFETVGLALTQLTPNTTYYYRVVATNSAGTTQGSIRSFTTQPADGTITFEQYPDGTPVIANSALTNEFSSLGVRFSFSSQYTDLKHAQLIRSSDQFDPANSPINHSVTTPSVPGHGAYYTGTIQMDLGHTSTATTTTYPTSVRVRLRGRGSDPGVPFRVRAVTSGGNLSTTITGSTTYVAVDGQTWKEQTWTFASPSPSGIVGVTVWVDDLMVIDDLRLTY